MEICGLSEEEKKAIKELTEVKELVEEDLKYKDYEVTATLDQIDLESLVIVINLIQKQDTEINKLNNVIDRMADCIYDCIYGEPTFGYGHLRDVNILEKIKEYFMKE